MKMFHGGPRLVPLVMLAASITLPATLIIGCVSTRSSPTPPAAQSTRSDLSGEWLLTTRSQVGAEEAHMVIRQSGDKLTGTITGQQGSVACTGTVKGSAVAFGFTLGVRGMDLKVDYSGQAEADTIRGTAVFGQFGEGTFTARRK